MPENIPINEELENIKIHPVYFKTKELPFNFPCFTTHPRSKTTFYELTDEEYEIYKDTFDRAIAEEINNFQPDIIHSGHIWTLSALASKYEIPLIITAHGTDLLGLQKNDERYFKDAMEAYRKSSAIIAISEDNAKLVKETFQGSENKVYLIPNGYDSDIFKKTGCIKENILKKYGITKKFKNIISFAGKFTEIKGIDTLIKAAKIYENNDILTILAGDGELMDYMKKLVNQLDVKNIIFLGNLAPIYLQEIFEIADVSVVPSRSEAFGIVAIEAIACGTPVVASRVGGLPSIINNEVGLTFDVENYAELAEKIMFILKRKYFNSETLAHYAKENYSQDNFTEQLSNLYKENIMNNSKKRI